jgi:hypothetical protein
MVPRASSRSRTVSSQVFHNVAQLAGANFRKKNTADLGACDHEPLATIIAKSHLTTTISPRSDTPCAGLPELREAVFHRDPLTWVARALDQHLDSFVVAVSATMGFRAWYHLQRGWLAKRTLSYREIVRIMGADLPSPKSSRTCC